MKEINNKLAIECLERLKRNPDYQYLCTELELIKQSVEYKIFDEKTPACEKAILISKRNIIKSFIELPDDLLTDFKITTD